MIHKQTVDTELGEIDLADGLGAVETDDGKTVLVTSDERGWSESDLTNFCDGLKPIDTHPYEDGVSIDVETQ